MLNARPQLLAQFAYGYTAPFRPYSAVFIPCEGFMEYRYERHVSRQINDVTLRFGSGSYCVVRDLESSQRLS